MKAFVQSPNTLVEFDRESTQADIEKRLRALQGCFAAQEDYSLLVYAMGAQPSSRISQLRAMEGVEVIFERSLIPAFLAPLRFLISSRACAFRLINPNRLQLAFQMVLEGAMVGLYATRREYMQAIVERIRRVKSIQTLDFGAKRDPGYLVYTVDADNFESGTGIYEIISFGRDAPICVRDCFD